jgi:hypothetical protein
VWRAIIDCGAAPDVEASLLATYDASPAVLSRDIREFIDSLIQGGLLETGP